MLEDLEESSHTGHVMFIDEDLSQTLSFLNGKPVSSVLWRKPEGIRRFYGSDKNIFANLGEKVSLEVLVAEKDAIAMTQIFCRSNAIFKGPRQIATAAGGVQAVCSSLETAILCRITNGVCETALLEKGKFTAGYFFDKEEKKFIRTGKSFLESNSESDAFFEVYNGGLSSPLPKIEKGDNPLEIIIDKYILVFQMAEEILQKKCSDKNQPLEKLVEGLKSKYPPLYKGVYRNPESGQTNWSLMLKNRNKVDMAYRYDKFMLYFDELLMGHIKLLHIHCKKEGLLAFFERVNLMKEHTPDLNYPPTGLFFQKLDNISVKISSNG